MAERMLGLDVGTTAVRVVEVVLDRPGKTPVVSRVGEVPLPAGAVRDGEVADVAAVGAAIAELWRQTGLRRRPHPDPPRRGRPRPRRPGVGAAGRAGRAADGPGSGGRRPPLDARRAA